MKEIIKCNICLPDIICVRSKEGRVALTNTGDFYPNTEAIADCPKFRKEVKVEADLPPIKNE
jgi:hypothetical protein